MLLKLLNAVLCLPKGFIGSLLALNVLSITREK